MENEQSVNYFKVIGKALLKIVLGLILLLLLLFAGIFVAIRFPAVQTKVAQKAAAYLSRTIGHQVTIGKVDIDFFSELVLDQVRVLDIRKNELFYVGQLKADINTFSIFNPNTLYISSLTLQQPRANLVKYAGTDSLNLSTFITSLQKLITQDTTKKSTQPFQFSIDEVVLQNGRFTYDDFNIAPASASMDYRHMTVDSIYGHFSEFLLEDTLAVKVKGLRANETRSKTALHKLDSKITFAPTFWEWDNLDLQLNKSNLTNYVRFDYNRFGNFTEFIDSVRVTASIKDSKLYSQDIATFATALSQYNETVFIKSGDVKGKVGNFTARNLDLTYGKNTHIVGNASAEGLPEVKETFINLRLQPSSIDASDLKAILPKNAYTIVARLGTVKLDGRFLGFYDDFVANGKFATALGKVESDINLKINERTGSSVYKGFLKTNGFNLGRLLNQEKIIKTISMSGRIAGSGFTLQNADTDVDVTVNQVQLNGYNYRNIKADGTLSNQVFVGTVAINDPNMKLAADGTINLSDNNKAFNLIADVQRIDLQALKMTAKPVVISARADLNFSGLKLDDFVGTARLDCATLTYEGKNIALDSVLIDSSINPGSRNLTLRSAPLDLKIDGDFNYSTLISDLQKLIDEYKLNFESNEAATAAYYQRKPAANGPEYGLTYAINLRDANPLIQLFEPKVSISENTSLTGSFRHGPTVILELYSHIDTIMYDAYLLEDNNLELNTSKLQNNPDVLAATLFTSEKQQLTNNLKTENFYLEGIWSERTINFATSLRQQMQNNRTLITGDLTFLQDQLQIKFDKSNITLQNTPWAFTPGNTLYISDAGKTLVFENFAITNQNQTIRAKGEVSDDPASILNLETENFNLANLNPLLSMKIGGTLNATVSAQDIYDRAILNAGMKVDSFYLDEIYIGNIAGQSNWNNAIKQAVVDVGIERENKKVLSVTGNYNPNAEEDQLDLLAVLDQTNLKLVEPVLNTIMSDLKGEMEGRIRVLGRLDSPILKGSVMVNNGQFTFDYLNTTYRFSDRIYLGPNSISFRSARLTDIYGNVGTVSGGIAHDGFQDMVLDMEARYRNFMVLNTTEEQNELFYGTAFATGTASILGPTNNLRVNIDARSNENTRIVLPLDNQTEVASKDYIRFVNTNPENIDSTKLTLAAEDERVDLSGINLNFELDVTDDAYFEIIIDRTTGDVIRGSGNGDIRMTIDTRGEFNMYGTFEIEQGAYNLNLLEGLVSREFNVQPGGTITWNGDPLAGEMALTGNYTQMASLSNILGATGSTTALQGRYPITAVIDLKGPLLTPQIDLGINFDQVPQVPETEAIINSIRNDEAERNRQVFSLLVLQRLSPVGTFSTEGAAAGAVGGSLGSLLSGQLSSFFNSIDSNLEIDIGLGTFDRDALSALQVRLSYTFLEGRLRITNQTGFGGTTTGLDRGGYEGDWFLEYYITQGGELRARLEYNTLRGFDNRRTNSQSASLLHTKRFDTFAELFRSERRNRRIERREQERERIILESEQRREF
ncbi:hypothetical protein DP923_07135 [Pontibacter arcticus]|uniref:Translocation and assembly module TamB C-terminal domain-containing protein n=1 Tax=Pontibacter arcticus TaxID=2080288 RepID=A0A364RFH3_9BACT|nr:hypothetical protein DP923_07135 [Pontibacter arcticus]